MNGLRFHINEKVWALANGSRRFNGAAVDAPPVGTYRGVVEGFTGLKLFPYLVRLENGPLSSRSDGLWYAAEQALRPRDEPPKREPTTTWDACPWQPKDLGAVRYEHKEPITSETLKERLKWFSSFKG